ncbi:MAG: hypothetical protein WC734_01820 [Patescibacteria group bacterium]|jgi:hypothetical protein
MKLPQYFKDKIILLLAGVAIIINGSLWWLLYSKFQNQTEYVPLHYNIYFGIDLYGPWHRILIMPLSGTGFIFINLALSIIMYKRARPMVYVLLAITVILQALLLWAGWLMRRELII